VRVNFHPLFYTGVVGHQIGAELPKCLNSAGSADFCVFCDEGGPERNCGGNDQSIRRIFGEILGKLDRDSSNFVVDLSSVSFNSSQLVVCIGTEHPNLLMEMCLGGHR
jgi:hypothetical protein